MESGRGECVTDSTDLLRPELRAWNRQNRHLLYNEMVFETALTFAPFCCRAVQVVESPIK